MKEHKCEFGQSRTDHGKTLHTYYVRCGAPATECDKDTIFDDWDQEWVVVRSYLCNDHYSYYKLTPVN